MAVEIFLKFTPEVKGESKAKGFEGQIQVFSWSFGASNPTTIGTGGGASSGKVQVSGLSLQKEVDAASVFLFKQCCLGKHFDGAKLIQREAGGDAPVEFLIADMKMVFIESISWGGSAGGGKPSESVNLAFGAIELTYNEQTEKGGATKHGPVQWSLVKNDASLGVS